MGDTTSRAAQFEHPTLQQIRAALACARAGCACGRPGGLVHCPAHDDRNPSISVAERNGKLLVRCFAGCAQDAVIAALRERGLWPERIAQRNEPNGRATRRLVASYAYRDASGRLLFEVLRYEPKSFRQRRPDGRGGWTYNLDGVERVLYRLPGLVAADKAQAVYVAEGERDVEALRAAGAVATCNAGGAGKWRPEYTEALRGRHVIVVRDRDEPGRRHAEQVIASLRGVAASVRLVEPRSGKDAADHLATGYSLDDFVHIPLDAAPSGAELLDDIERFIRRFVVLPNEGYVAMTLWTAHAHALEHAESTPRLSFLSPEPECGKTRALEVLELLVPNAMLAVNATPAALFRAVADLERKPTLLFDEIDTIFGPKAKENEELRGLLNAGHRRSGVAYRCVGEGTKQKVQPFPAFAAVALAGIGDLPDTILSRSIVIAMRRRRADEHVEPFRRRQAEAEGSQLRSRLERWCAWHARELSAIPAMPSGLTDRAADAWEPLFAIADAAGGHWPERARVAAVALLAAKAEKEPSLGVRLLADIREIFEREDKDALPTALLLERLNALEEAPWRNLRGKELDAYSLARRLAAYSIKSKNIRTAVGVTKGYAREDFYEAWQRYLRQLPEPASPLGNNSATSATAATTRNADVADNSPCSASDPLQDPNPLQRNGAVSPGDADAVAAVADVAAFWRDERHALNAPDDLVERLCALPGVRCQRPTPSGPCGGPSWRSVSGGYECGWCSQPLGITVEAER